MNNLKKKKSRGKGKVYEYCAYYHTVHLAMSCYKLAVDKLMPTSTPTVPDSTVSFLTRKKLDVMCATKYLTVTVTSTVQYSTCAASKYSSQGLFAGPEPPHPPSPHHTRTHAHTYYRPTVAS